MRRLLLFLVVSGGLLLALPGLLDANGAIYRVDCYLSRQRDFYASIYVYERVGLPNAIQMCVKVYGGTPQVTPLSTPAP